MNLIIAAFCGEISLWAELPEALNTRWAAVTASRPGEGCCFSHRVGRAIIIRTFLVLLPDLVTGIHADVEAKLICSSLTNISWWLCHRCS